MKLIQKFHQTVLTRVYPPAANIQSGNYNPIPHWMCGAQLVSFNVQTAGLPLQTNTAMFTTNGNPGYVLKNPEETNKDNSSSLGTLKVLSARHNDTEFTETSEGTLPETKCASDHSGSRITGRDYCVVYRKRYKY